MGVHSNSSTPQIVEQSHVPIAGDTPLQDHSNNSAAYFQVTTWLTSLRRSTWMSNTGAHTSHETFEQLIDQHTTRTTAEPTDAHGFDRSLPRISDSFTTQVHFPTWLQSFRRPGWIQGASSFAGISESASESALPSAANSLASLQGERLGIPVEFGHSIESKIEDELSESPFVALKNRQHMPSMLNTPTESVIADVQMNRSLDSYNKRQPGSDWNTTKLEISQNNSFETPYDSDGIDRNTINEMPGAWYCEDDAS